VIVARLETLILQRKWRAAGIGANRLFLRRIFDETGTPG